MNDFENEYTSLEESYDFNEEEFSAQEYLDSLDRDDCNNIPF